MELYILTLFPEYFDSVFGTSILVRAQKKQLITVSVINIRDFATDKHSTTDDRPFGGGPGMVMKVEPIFRALDSLKPQLENKKYQTILTSAKGEQYTQQKANKYADLDALIIICGHYEGVDERVAEHLVDAEISIGEYVLTGGEPAAAVIADSVIRLIPGVLGNEASNQNESHAVPGKKAHPQYTRPREFNGWSIPEVLLTGSHAKISEFREKIGDSQ